MPYKSKAQQGLFHSPNSPVSKATVEEFDRASKGLKLPARKQYFEGGEVDRKEYERLHARRAKDGVESPDKPTNLSFAAHLAQKAQRTYDLPWSARHLKRK